MADRSAIEWTDATWNPIVAYNLISGKKGHFCEHVSEGCRNCYAERFQGFLGNPGARFARQARDNVKIGLDEAALLRPLRWRKPRRIFVCSMTDLFADFVEDEWIDRLFAVMALCPQHIFQVLTKRSGRMNEWSRTNSTGGHIFHVAAEVDPHKQGAESGAWPLPNVWLGVSVEDQANADARIPDLLATPAAIRFVSYEPALGPVSFAPKSDKLYADLSQWYGPQGFDPTGSQPRQDRRAGWFPKIDWIIAGGESGPHARPAHIDWFRSVRDQCAAARVAFFFKQWGEWLPWTQFTGARIDDDLESTRFDTREWNGPIWTDVGRPIWADSVDGNIDDQQCVARVGKKRAGRLLDGVEHNAMPERRA